MAINEISRDELKAFCESAKFAGIIQKNHEKYKTRWIKWAEKKETIKFGTTQSWNWAGFFLSEFWLLYRKLYTMAFLVIFMRILSIILPFFLPEFNNLFSLLPFIISVMVGVLSYDWYLMKTYTIYTVAKESSEEVKKEKFAKEGGTSIKFPVIYLIASILFVALGVMATMGTFDDESSSVSSGSSSNIEFVRSGVFDFDPSIYLGNALENYPYFSAYTWSEYTSPQGRQLVRFTAFYNLVSDLQTLGVLSEQINMEIVPTVEFNIDFAIDVDGTNYEIFGGVTRVNGEVLSQYAGDEAFEILQLVYQSQPIQGNGVTLGQLFNYQYNFISE